MIAEIHQLDRQQDPHLRSDLDHRGRLQKLSASATKPLEEPPPMAVFVLVTAAPDTLLPTVVSRCQRVRFGRLAPADVARVLVATQGYGEADARAAASVADGSVGSALEGGSDQFADAREAALAVLTGVARMPGPASRLGLAKDLAATGAARGAAEREALAQRLRALAS